MEWFDNLCSNFGRFFEENDPSPKNLILLIGSLIAVVIMLVMIISLFPVNVWVYFLFLFGLYCIFWFISHGYLSIHKED